MTFGDMILDCAERWGHADQSGTLPGLPTDAAILDLIKRKINAGYHEFLRADRKWTFVRQRVQVLWCPNGDGPFNIPSAGLPDGGRYRLPSYVGSQPHTDWTYVTTGRPPMVIQTIDAETVRRRMAAFRTKGIPAWAGVSPIQTDDGINGQGGKGWEVMFYPRPQNVSTVEAIFSVRQHVLKNLEERHVAGSDHDRTIIAFADHQWYKDDAEDPTVSAGYAGEMANQLAQSMLIDQERRPRQHGKLVDPKTLTVPVNRYVNLGAITYNGSPVPTP